MPTGYEEIAEQLEQEMGVDTQEQQQEEHLQSENESDNADLAVSENEQEELVSEAKEGANDPDEEEIILDEDDLHLESNSPFSKAKEVLGFEANSLEDIKSAWETKENEYKSQLEKVKEAQTLVQSDELRDLAEFVQKGGKVAEFKDATAQIVTLQEQKNQLSQVDPVMALKAHLKQNIGLTDEQLEDYTSTKSEVELLIEGKKILKSWEADIDGEINAKQNSISKLKEKQQERFNSLVNSLSDAIDKKQAFLGVSVTASEKALLKQVVAQPLKAVSEFFPVDEHGNYDAEKWAESIMTLKLAARKADVLKRKAQSDGARQVVEGRANLPKPNAPRAAQGTKTDVISEGISAYLDN